MAFAGEGQETWGEVTLGWESYPGKPQSPTLRPNGRSGAEQGPQNWLWRAWASLADPSMPTCKIRRAGGSSDRAQTAPRFGGPWPDQLWKPRLAGMGCGRKGPQRNFLSPAVQAQLGLLSPYRPLGPTHCGFFTALER